MRIAIIGTRGIPNRYGGFEQFASHIAPMLVQNGHDVYVYNTSAHSYKGKSWRGVHIIAKYDPEKIMGTSGQFVYDLLCILDARKRNFDLILQLGYTSSSMWGFLFPHKAILATNMDGMEWKRAKYNRLTRKFLQQAEAWAVKRSDVLIADAEAMRRYLRSHYKKDACYIPYGAFPFQDPDPTLLVPYGLQPFGYDLLIARPERENNIEMIIRGHLMADSGRPLLIVGNGDNRYGKYLRKKYIHPSIIFMGSLYDMITLNNLRYYSNLYFHGHSVGGTNPSLLEAMAARCLIVAHDNVFNREVLGRNAYYFKKEADIARLLKTDPVKQAHATFIESNLQKIEARYNWEHIVYLIEHYVIQGADEKQKAHATEPVTLVAIR